MNNKQESKMKIENKLSNGLPPKKEMVLQEKQTLAFNSDLLAKESISPGKYYFLAPLYIKKQLLFSFFFLTSLRTFFATNCITIGLLLIAIHYC